MDFVAHALHVAVFAAAAASGSNTGIRNVTNRHEKKEKDCQEHDTRNSTTSPNSTLTDELYFVENATNCVIPLQSGIYRGTLLGPSKMPIPLRRHTDDFAKKN